MCAQVLTHVIARRDCTNTVTYSVGVSKLLVLLGRDSAVEVD